MTQQIASQSGAYTISYSRGPNHPLIFFEHLSLYIQKRYLSIQHSMVICGTSRPPVLAVDMKEDVLANLSLLKGDKCFSGDPLALGHHRLHHRLQHHHCHPGIRRKEIF